ncbi:hypothetical protein [Modestobacter versicolor]|uniref:hypothetical protein n=1 Tax=Modestobacter versicolor TaxID=429133 RepID=UPI0034DE5E97
MTGLPDSWGATPAELQAGYRCDELAPDGHRLVRAVTSAAAAPEVYRWLCQLRVAPYSYDWLDNFGRTSPRRLVPGLEELAAGQRVMTIFELVHHTPGRDLTVTIRPGVAEQVFGPVAVTYRVIATPGGSRLVAVLRIGHRQDGRMSSVRRRLLAWGDLLMMRKQLLTLARLAEAGG